MKSVRTILATVVLLTAVTAGMTMFVWKCGRYAYEHSSTLRAVCGVVTDVWKSGDKPSSHSNDVNSLFTRPFNPQRTGVDGLSSPTHDTVRQAGREANERDTQTREMIDRWRTSE